MSKFKIGDRVVCVNSRGEDYNGSGWELGKEFTISHIKKSLDVPCYFPLKGNGVFEYGLKLVYSEEKRHPRRKLKIKIK